MTRLATLAVPTPAAPAARVFAAVALLLAIAAAFLAGWAPLGFSLVTVFLFAGPHNWVELRYFLTRTPARWGPLRPFFLVAFSGVIALAAAFAVLAALPIGPDRRLTAYAIWDTALLTWLAGLALLRSRQKPRRDWSWVLPAAPALVAAAWAAPAWFALALVYLHPLMALAILDREIRRSRPKWHRAYRLCLATVPLLLAALWWRLAGTPDLPGDDALTIRVAGHAGAGLLRGVSTHLLVATHAFLEMLHYGVWLLAIPLVGIRTLPWRLGTVPLARRSPRWKLLLVGLLALSATAVLLLWGCFLADYPLTRDVYFTLAIAHVLAEFPFLLRAL